MKWKKEHKHLSSHCDDTIVGREVAVEKDVADQHIRWPTNLKDFARKKLKLGEFWQENI